MTQNNVNPQASTQVIPGLGLFKQIEKARPKYKKEKKNDLHSIGTTKSSHTPTLSFWISVIQHKCCSHWLIIYDLIKIDVK